MYQTKKRWQPLTPKLENSLLSILRDKLTGPRVFVRWPGCRYTVLGTDTTVAPATVDPDRDTVLAVVSDAGDLIKP